MGLTGFNARRRAKYADAKNRMIENQELQNNMQNGISQGNLPNDDAGKKRYQLMQMNKPELLAYSKEIGLLLDDAMKKAQIVELIQQREQEM